MRLPPTSWMTYTLCRVISSAFGLPARLDREMENGPSLQEWNVESQQRASVRTRASTRTY